MSSNSNDTFLMAGDYNLADTITWSFDSAKMVHQADNVIGSIPNGLLDVLSLCNFNQFNVIRNVNDRTFWIFLCLTQKRVVSKLLEQMIHW